MAAQLLDNGRPGRLTAPAGAAGRLVGRPRCVRRPGPADLDRSAPDCLPAVEDAFQQGNAGQPAERHAWGGRDALPSKATAVLDNWLLTNAMNPYMDGSMKELYAADLGITFKQVARYLINRRSRLLYRRVIRAPGRTRMCTALVPVGQGSTAFPCMVALKLPVGRGRPRAPWDQDPPT